MILFWFWFTNHIKYKIKQNLRQLSLNLSQSKLESSESAFGVQRTIDNGRSSLRWASRSPNAARSMEDEWVARSAAQPATTPIRNGRQWERSSRSDGSMGGGLQRRLSSVSKSLSPTKSFSAAMFRASQSGVSGKEHGQQNLGVEETGSGADDFAATEQRGESLEPDLEDLF